MKYLRLAIIGFGTVAQGFVALLAARQHSIKHDFGLEVTLVSVANAHDGFIYCQTGLDIPTLLELAASRRPLTEHPGVTHWANTLEGFTATDADVLAEATRTNLHDAEPGISHIRTALARGMHVITTNKGPGALAAQELFALAHQHGVELRMESTVMAGTPVLSTIREGMAGAQISAIRGILNGTTNYILSAMARGRDYNDVLLEAQAQGFAEADPTADVEGYDALAKILILSSLVFGRSLKPGDVYRQGITAITREQVQRADANGQRIKLIASIVSHPGEARLEAKVAPVELPLNDPLAHVDGVTNAITIHSDTLPEVTVIGPGAGRLQTGQGLLADLLAIAKAS